MKTKPGQIMELPTWVDMPIGIVLRISNYQNSREAKKRGEGYSVHMFNGDFIVLAVGYLKQV